MEHIRYKKETEVVTFQEKEITLENLSPVFTPDQEAANIRLIFEMYAQPTTSYGDITWYFAEQRILFNGKELIRPTLAQIAELTVEAISPEQVSQISGYLDTWENVSFDDKRRVVDLMLTTIAATSDSLNITWKI